MGVISRMPSEHAIKVRLIPVTVRLSSLLIVTASSEARTFRQRCVANEALSSPPNGAIFSRVDPHGFG
jgi:hypothetical protein